MISTKEAASKLGVSDRRVRVLCASGRIMGAKLIGNSWVIPSSPVVVPPNRARKVSTK